MKEQRPTVSMSYKPSAKMGVLCLALWWLMLPCAAFGQARKSTPDEIADDIARVKSGGFYGAAVEQIAEAHAVQAIPVLKEQFAISQDASVKAKIAGALVRLGDKDEIYWNYLIEQATEAIHSSLPLPAVYDSRGALVRGQVSPEFIAWAKAHNVSPESAGEDAAYGLPGKVAMLGETGDPRGVPLLRQALQSPNFLIAAMAAKSLALIQDKGSIPLIIEASRKAPSDAAVAIADSLIYFDDAEAQRGADLYLPKTYAAAVREARAHGKTPFHY